MNNQNLSDIRQYADDVQIISLAMSAVLTELSCRADDTISPHLKTLAAAAENCSDKATIITEMANEI